MTYSVADLNELLASALGTNPYGEPKFQWMWSEDLVWPEFPTGGTVTKSVEIPLIGGGVELADMIVPEYRVEKMCPKLDRQWVIALWYPPEDLGHWQAMFPGGVYPTRGYRINTNASLPSYPGGPREPNIRDTERFIELLREQRSMSHHDRVVDMIAEDDKQKAAVQREIEDEIANDFTAFMNPEPGKRGGFVSFPSTEKESGTLVQ